MPRHMIQSTSSANCAVHTCYYSIPRPEDGDKVSYFRLPKNEERAKLWLDAIGRKPNVPHLYVCELHFAKNFISVVSSGMRLVATAAPTLNLPKPGEPPGSSSPHRAARPAQIPRDNPSTALPGPAPHDHPVKTYSKRPVKLKQPEDVNVEVDIFVKEETVVTPKRTHEEVEPSTSFLPDRPVKRERLDEDRASTATLDRQAELNKFLEMSNAYLEPELATYIKAKVHLQTHARSKNVDEKLLVFALKLYHSFPQTYKLMQRALGLPSTLQIRRLFRPQRGEVCPEWARLLGARFAGVAPAARTCVVCVACVPLRPALAYDAPRDRLLGLAPGLPPRRARLAIVMLARGMHKPWRQPLVCRLLPAQPDVRDLRLWIKRVVSQLFALGLDVRALVTDFDDHFVPTAPIVLAEQPYFMVDKERVYCFYDHTQLMISFRDYFMQYDINFQDLTATWEVIEKLHEYNRNSDQPLRCGLTDDHLKPPEKETAGVAGTMQRRNRLAAEALARPVGDAIGVARERGVLGVAVRGTVQLVETVADLHDMMHKELAGGTKKYYSDVKLLNDLIWRLNKMSLVSKESGLAAPDPGLLTALRAGLYVATALLERARRDGTALPMRVFNNDPLHEFFDRQRALHRGVALTGGQIFVAFKRSFVFNAMKSLKSKKNGQLEEFMKAASEIRNVARSGPVAPSRAVPLPKKQWSALLRAIRQPRSAAALAWQLLSCCLEFHSCCSLARAYCQSELLPEGLLRYMELMSRVFHTHFEEFVGGTAGLLNSLLNLMTNHHFEAPCACFPTLYLKTMFFRFKIHTFIKFNNKILLRNSDAKFSVITAVQFEHSCKQAAGVVQERPLEEHAREYRNVSSIKR